MLSILDLFFSHTEHRCVSVTETASVFLAEVVADYVHLVVTLRNCAVIDPCPIFRLEGPTVELHKLLVKVRISLLDLISIGIDLLELPGEFWEAIKEFFYDNYTKCQSLSISPKRLDNKLQTDILENRIKQLVFDNGAK